MVQDLIFQVFKTLLLGRYFLTLMRPVADLNMKKWTKPWNMILIWEYSARAFQWRPTWQGIGYQRSLHPRALDKSSLSIGRVKNVRLFELFKLTFYRETVGRNLEHKREKREKYQTLVNSLSKTVNELSQEKLQIDQQLQQRNKLQENKEQLVKDNHTYKDDIEVSTLNYRRIRNS